MSNEPLYSAEPPQNPGMSGTTKVLLGCAIAAGVLMLLVCGGMIAAFFYAQSYLKNAMVDDPAAIRRMTSEIVTIEVPPGLEPKLGLNLEVPVTKEPLAIAVVYAGEQEHSALSMFEFLMAMPEEQRKQVQTQLEQSMSQQAQRQRKIEIQESKTHDTEIHGQPAHFIIAKGQDTSSKQDVWQVTGEFQGAKGAAVLMFAGPVEKFTEDDIVKMLDSMK